jgi:Rrf2 family protein
MLLTTRSQNAIRFLLALGKRPAGAVVSLKEISDQSQLPHAYLEQILPSLRKANLVKAHRGAYGGYSLLVPLSTLNVWQVVSAVEHSLDQTACKNQGNCQQHDHACDLHHFLNQLNQHVQHYFKQTTLADLTQSKTEKTLAFLPLNRTLS